MCAFDGHWIRYQPSPNLSLSHTHTHTQGRGAGAARVRMYAFDEHWILYQPSSNLPLLHTHTHTQGRGAGTARVRMCVFDGHWIRYHPSRTLFYTHTLSRTHKVVVLARLEYWCVRSTGIEFNNACHELSLSHTQDSGTCMARVRMCEFDGYWIRQRSSRTRQRSTWGRISIVCRASGF